MLGKPLTSSLSILCDTSCWQVDGPPTHIAWSHPESGRLLAVAGEDGEVRFWEAPIHARSSSPEADEETPEYRQVSSLRCSSGKPIRWVDA